MCALASGSIVNGRSLIPLAFASQSWVAYARPIHEKEHHTRRKPCYQGPRAFDVSYTRPTPNDVGEVTATPEDIHVILAGVYDMRLRAGDSGSRPPRPTRSLEQWEGMDPALTYYNFRTSRDKVLSNVVSNSDIPHPSVVSRSTVYASEMSAPDQPADPTPPRSFLSQNQRATVPLTRPAKRAKRE
jgi:hypothetical protein